MDGFVTLCSITNIREWTAAVIWGSKKQPSIQLAVQWSSEISVTNTITTSFVQKKTVGYLQGFPADTRRKICGGINLRCIEMIASPRIFFTFHFTAYDCSLPRINVIWSHTRCFCCENATFSNKMTYKGRNIVFWLQSYKEAVTISGTVYLAEVNE